jgi:hypothetical protein
MKSNSKQSKKKISDRKSQELDEALKFSQMVDKKIQEFNFDSAQFAEKWQKKAEDRASQDKKSSE